MTTRTITTRMRIEVADAKRTMNELAASTDKVRYGAERSGTALGRMLQSASANEQAWNRAGVAMTAFGAAAAAGVGYAVKSAIQWESAWTGVLKTVDGTPAQLGAIEEGLRELARTLPATHTEIAAVAEAAGQLGVQAKDVVAFTRVMVDLGETTNLSADEAATSIAQLMNVMQTAPDAVDNLGASLVALGNNGASTERDIVQMAQRIAGSGKIIGLTEGEVLGLANALASVGIEVEAGGTAISTIMTDIAKAVATGSDDLTQWAQVAGMSAGDFADAWRADPADALATFVEGLGRVNAAGGDVFTTLDRLGQSDVRVSRALLTMANSGDLLRKSLALGNEAWDENTALVAEAAKRYDTTEAKLQIARNGIEDAAITIGESLTPVVADAAGALAKMAGWVGGLPEPLLGAAGGVTALAAGIGLLGGAFALALPRALATRTALRELRDVSPRVASGLGKVGKAAAVAGAAFTVFEIAATIAGTAMDDLPGVSETTANLLALGDAGKKSALELKAARDKLDEIYTVTGSGGAAVKGLSDAIETLDMNGFLKTLDTIGSLGIFDSDQKIANGLLGQFDSAITSLAQSGATEDVAAALEYFNEQAQAAGVAPEKALELLPQYQEYLSQADAQQQQAGDSAKQLAGSLGYAGEMTEEAAKALQEWRDMVAEADASFVDLQGAYDAVISKNQEVAQSTADASKSSKDSWQDYYDGVSVSSKDYIAQLKAQVDAQSDWEANMLAIAKRVNIGMTGEMRDAGNAMIDELLDLGPEGAAQVALLESMTDKQFAKVVSLWSQRGTDAVAEFTQKVEGYRQPVITPDVDSSGAQNALDYFITINTGRRIPITIHPTGPGLTPYIQGYAGGGAISGPGTGTSDSMWARVSNGEHVLTASDVAKAGGQSAIYRMRGMLQAGLLNFASGGAIGAARREREAALREWRAAAERAKKASARANGSRSDADQRAAERAQDAADTAREAYEAARDRLARLQDTATEVRTASRRGSLIGDATSSLSGAYGLVDQLRAMAANSDYTKNQRDTLEKRANAAEAAFRRLYGQADKIEKKVASARDRVSELASIKASASSALSGGFQIGGLFGQTTEFGYDKPVTGRSILAGAQQYAGKVRAFASKLSAVRKRLGPSSGVILQQLVGLGVDDGMQAADAILSLSATESGQLSAAFGEIQKYSDQAGQAVTEGFYKGGLSAAQGVLDGLEKDQREIEKRIERIAERSADAIRRALGIGGGGGSSRSSAGSSTASTPKSMPANVRGGSSTVVKVSVSQKDAALIGAALAQAWHADPPKALLHLSGRDAAAIVQTGTKRGASLQ